MSECRLAAGIRGAALRLALRVLHVLVIAHQLLAVLLTRARAEASRLLPFLFNRVQRNSRGKRPAFPTTVALVVAEDWAGDASLDVLASLVRWCAAAGVQNIQVFDPAGEAKQAAASLHDRLNFAREPIFSVQVGFSDGCGEGTAQRKLKNLRLLGGQDAVAPLLAAAQLQRSQPGSTAEAEGGSSPPAALMARLQQAAGSAALQAPELILSFGPARSLAGFPPWLARQSEIYAAGRLADAREGLVAACLARYCRTSQRFGA